MLRFLRRVFVILVLLFVVFVIFRIVNPTATANFVDKVKSIPQTVSGWFHRKADNAKNIVVDWIDTVLTWDISQPKWSEKIETKEDLSDSEVTTVSEKKASRKDSKTNTKKDESQYSWWDSIGDFVRLEKLNEETKNNILIKTGKDTSISSGIVIVVNSWCETDQCKKIEQDLKNLAKEVENLKITMSGLNEKIESNTWNIVFVELKNEETNTNSENNVQSNTSQNNTQNNTPTTSQTTTKTTTTTTKKRTNCCDANCVLSQSECAEVNMIWNLFE